MILGATLLPFVALSEVVAARTLRVGAVVTASDLKISEDQSAEDLTDIIGKETKRAIYQGREITPNDVGPVTIVQRNEVISLVYRSSGLGLRTEGRALNAAGVGEPVSVMNLDTRITVRAVVVGPKRAEVLR